MKPLKRYAITLELAGAIAQGIYDCEIIEEVFTFLSEEYPQHTIISVIEVPTRKL